MGTLEARLPVDGRILARWPDFLMTPDLARLIAGRHELFCEFAETLEVPDRLAPDRAGRSRYIQLRFFLAVAQQQARAVAQAAVAGGPRLPGVPGVPGAPPQHQAWNSARGDAAKALAQARAPPPPPPPPARRSRTRSPAPSSARVHGVPPRLGPASDDGPGAPGVPGVDAWPSHGAKHFDEVMPLLSWLDWAPVVDASEESQLFHDLEAGVCYYENERWTQVWERFLRRGYAGFAGELFDERATEVLRRKVEAMGTHPGAAQLQRMAAAMQHLCRESRVEFLESLGPRQRQRLLEIEAWLLDLGTQYVRHLRAQGVDVQALALSQFCLEPCQRLAAVRQWAARTRFRTIPGGWAAAAAVWRIDPGPEIPGVAASALRDLLRLGPGSG